MLEPVRQAAHRAATAEDVDVVVVGAGAAGLAAARHLTGAGLRAVVLEAAPDVGGRMATEKVDGFRLDRLGRPLSTSHPELRHTPGLDSLVLRPFSPGVLLHSDGHHHRAAAPGSPRSARGALTTARALASAPRLPLPRPARGTSRPGPLGGAL
ncbi:FAD-dependent oxidoreductase, partial [Streptomyces sp. NPDC007084]|uniref:FAD-dependent oxidoreductase n=1 Tax=Streptomyces sp. NPDC007084 TaxID=3154313 RepID=UPI003455CCAA